MCRPQVLSDARTVHIVATREPFGAAQAAAFAAHGDAVGADAVALLAAGGAPLPSPSSSPSLLTSASSPKEPQPTVAASRVDNRPASRAASLTASVGATLRGVVGVGPRGGAPSQAREGRRGGRPGGGGSSGGGDAGALDAHHAEARAARELARLVLERQGGRCSFEAHVQLGSGALRLCEEVLRTTGCAAERAHTPRTYPTHIIPLIV